MAFFQPLHNTLIGHAPSHVPESLQLWISVQFPYRSPKRSHRAHGQHHDPPRHSPHHKRESSVTLFSVSPNRRSPSYDFEAEDRERERQRQARLNTRPPEPRQPPTYYDKDDSWSYTPSNRDTTPSHDSTQWQYDDDWDTWGKWSAPRNPQPQSSWPTYQEYRSSDSWRDSYQSSRPDPPSNCSPATLRAAPASRSRPLTAYSAPGPKSKKPSKHKNKSDWDRHSIAASEAPPGKVNISLRDDNRQEWISHVRYGLRHRHRKKATSELRDDEQPVTSKQVDGAQYNPVYEGILRSDRRIPTWIAKQATDLLAASNLLESFDVSSVSILELPSTSTRALIVPVPEISRFSTPQPFRDKNAVTWALLHGTSLSAAQSILWERFIRPANWPYHPNPLKCGVPTFGAFYLGREINNETRFPEWVQPELMESAQKKGKGQQKVLFGVMYRGADPHTSFKAGGNEMAQLQVAKVGIVTTSEKYTISHSYHVGIQFFALRWQDLPMDDDGDSSDDLTYRGKRKRSTDRNNSPTEATAPPSTNRSLR